MLISSLANLERLITEKLKVSESDLKSLLLINRLIAELLDRCNGEVALEARDRQILRISALSSSTSANAS